MKNFAIHFFKFKTQITHSSANERNNNNNKYLQSRWEKMSPNWHSYIYLYRLTRIKKKSASNQIIPSKHSEYISFDDMMAFVYNG